MASDMQSSSCFDGLPNGVLRRIETSLDVKDRLAFFSCCRAARAYQVAATGGLWPELKLRLQGPEKTLALADWLARNRQHLGQCRLTVLLWAPVDPAQCNRAVDELLAALAASSVHTLRLDVMGIDFHLTDWVLGLPQLESLFLMAARLATSPVDLSPLTRLTSLTLGNSGIAVIDCPPTALPAAMPPHLRQLNILRYDARAFNACATAGALSELQDLQLGYPSEASLPWDWLPQLTALTSLSMYGWEALGALPPQLEALTGLQQLSIVDCFSLPPTNEALEPLSELTGLTRLNVSNNGWERIPACVFALPSLKDLDVSGWSGGTGLVVPDTPLAGSSSLTKLSLTAGLALGAAEQLCRFPALHTLTLTAREDVFEEEEEQHEAVGRLMGELRRLPRFELLHVGYVMHNVFRRFMEFSRELNLEYPYEIRLEDDRASMME